jgi:hypothetical protein
MKRVPRLFRIAGLFAVSLAALAATSDRASANCSLLFSPNPSTAGQTLTISTIIGDLSNTSSVTIGSNPATITSVSATQVQVTIPDEPAPTVTSIVTVPFGNNYGTTSGGQEVLIQGSNFDPTVNVTISGSTSCDGTYGGAFTYNDVTTVDIGGTAALSTNVVSSSALTATTPPGIAGVTNVVVITTTQNSGASGSNLWAYVAGGPSVTSIGPQQGLTTLTTPVLITGSNFVPGTFQGSSTPATTVTFNCGTASGSTNNGNASVSVGNTTNASATAPTCSTAGAVTVTVTTPAGSATTTYQYIAAATPVITTVTPNTGSIAGGTQITIDGSNFIGATSVTIGTQVITAFSINSPSEITTTTPAGTAGSANVSVTVPEASPATGTGTSAFTYFTPAPTVNSITPSSATTAGGTQVVITGQYFTGATQVQIGGTNVTSFTVNNDNQITATTAAHAAGTGLAVSVTTPTTTVGTGSATATSGGLGSTAGLFSYVAPTQPAITAISPNSGTTAGGTFVTFSGSGFTGATSVTFGGANATSFSVQTDNTVTATTPAGTAGAQNAVITTPGGTATTTYTYVTPASEIPTVTAISPTGGTTLGGIKVTITGTNFNGTPQVTIGGVAASQVTVVNATTITAVTPAGTGNAPVVVTTQFGSSTGTVTYQYQAPTPPAVAPTVTSVSPPSGPLAGSTPVTISGANFTGATSVTFGGNAATNVVVNANGTQISALTPAGAALGSVSVSVTTPAGTGTAANAFQYVSVAPTVTSVSPPTGTILGNTPVTITGTNFVTGASVNFGGLPATQVTVLNSSTIQANTPAVTTPGSVNVTVTTTAGTGTGTNLYTYVAPPPPTLTAINPNGGSLPSGNTAGGTQVTITGTNFTSPATVTIGGVTATIITVTATTITALTPAHAAGTVSVTVTTPAGSVTGTAPATMFTYVEGAPTVAAISPNSGPIAGGTNVTITGTNFVGVTSVTIGGNTPTAVTVVSSTSITATTTAHAAGLANVAVTTSCNGAGTSCNGVGTNLFTFVAPASAPTITGLAPATGPPGGGTSVTITGSNLTGATAVTFGGANAISFTVNSATSITATSPPGSGTVQVTVTTPGGAGTGGQFAYAKVTPSLTLTSSPNPSVLGQAVTFTAKVTGDSPTGTVTFSENGKVLGTATLSGGVATFTIATLPVGQDAVTASYGGDANNAADPETVIQTVNGTSDSARLRQMQLVAMPVEAGISSQAITGAIDSAIEAGFAGSCPDAPTPNGAGFAYCFDGSQQNASPAPQQAQNGSLAPQQAQNGSLAPQQAQNGSLAPQQAQNDAAAVSPQARAKVDDDFATLSYTDGLPGTSWSAPQDITPQGSASQDIRFAGDLTPRAAVTPAKAPYASPHDWLVWVDVRFTDFQQNSVGNDLKDLQENAMFGITRRFTPNFLFGVTGGYENFDFTSQAYNGVLKGQGGTAGAYVGWQFGHLRAEAAGTWSDIFISGSSGAASANFAGTRLLGFGGLTGTFAWFGTVFEPTTQVYTSWERENGYTDSLGTQQGSNDFDTGRGSGGLKISHAFPTGDGSIAPYVGFYCDYYFTMNNTSAAGVTTPTPILQGWAGRTAGGITTTFRNGAQLSAGGEYSGIGNNTQIWTVTVRGSVPF